MTLHADGRRWYGHGQASTDAAREKLKEYEHRARPDGFWNRRAQQRGHAAGRAAYQLMKNERALEPLFSREGYAGSAAVSGVWRVRIVGVR
jgi:hypothetical protein